VHQMLLLKHISATAVADSSWTVVHDSPLLLSGFEPELPAIFCLRFSISSFEEID